MCLQLSYSALGQCFPVCSFPFCLIFNSDCVLKIGSILELKRCEWHRNKNQKLQEECWCSWNSPAGIFSFVSQSVRVTKCRFALSGSFCLREHMVVPLWNKQLARASGHLSNSLSVATAIPFSCVHLFVQMIINSKKLLIFASFIKNAGSSSFQFVSLQHNGLFFQNQKVKRLLSR